MYCLDWWLVEPCFALTYCCMVMFLLLLSLLLFQDRCIKFYRHTDILYIYIYRLHVKLGAYMNIFVTQWHLCVCDSLRRPWNPWGPCLSTFVLVMPFARHCCGFCMFQLWCEYHLPLASAKFVLNLCCHLGCFRKELSGELCVIATKWESHEPGRRGATQGGGRDVWRGTSVLNSSQPFSFF